MNDQPNMIIKTMTPAHRGRAIMEEKIKMPMPSANKFNANMSAIISDKARRDTVKKM